MGGCNACKMEWKRKGLRSNDHGDIKRVGGRRGLGSISLRWGEDGGKEGVSELNFMKEVEGRGEGAPLNFP